MDTFLPAIEHPRNDAERPALDYATELTKEEGVSLETFKRLAGHFSERQICEIVWLVATERVYDITNIGMNSHSDRPCDIRRKK